MHKNLRSWLLAGLILTAASCKNDDVVTPPPGKYDNGFYIVSEGNFGVAPGDINYYDYDKDSIYKYVYSAENPGKKLGTSSTTMQFGTVYNDKLYLVGKYDGPLVAVDAATLKETGRVDSLPGHDGRAFLGVDINKGLLSTAAGLYRLTLTPLTLGTKVSSVDGEVKDMFMSWNYIFVISAKDGILALDAFDYHLVKKLGTAVSGFVLTKDDRDWVWAASATQLKRINVATLAVDSITTGFPVHFNEWTYTNSSMVASTKENAIFIISGNNKVYRYTGDAASLSTPFITLPAGQYFYGKGIAYDRKRNYLILNSNTNIYGADAKNTIYMYNATTGALQHSKTYEGFYFPGMVVFR
ncbi:DUF5074 domain-containing protein [Chitinophaga filiformis]|uniref:DUF5074 domain-containing protein n=1 Tax=Chitinophaga filiformis TaxID=104663 RepID=UPI001F1D239B|nr:DUF5074 domain-containing protein [Chitinophaga filiformis]MCF6405952.1 DUF5074 domain-containing protein [Chitinophaga filiformis]